MTIAACNSCGAQILWVVTANGKQMPVDAEPVVKTPHGLMTLSPVEGRTAHRADAVRGHLYRSHFATCPNAKEHRR